MPPDVVGGFQAEGYFGVRFRTLHAPPAGVAHPAVAGRDTADLEVDLEVCATSSPILMSGPVVPGAKFRGRKIYLAFPAGFAILSSA